MSSAFNHLPSNQCSLPLQKLKLKKGKACSILEMSAFAIMIHLITWLTWFLIFYNDRVHTYACTAASLDRGDAVNMWSSVEDTLLFVQDSHLNYCLQDNLGKRERRNLQPNVVFFFASLMKYVTEGCNMQCTETQAMTQEKSESSTQKLGHTLCRISQERCRELQALTLTHKHNRTFCSQGMPAPSHPWLGLT